MSVHVRCVFTVIVHVRCIVTVCVHVRCVVTVCVHVMWLCEVFIVRGYRGTIFHLLRTKKWKFLNSTFYIISPIQTRDIITYYMTKIFVYCYCTALLSFRSISKLVFVVLKNINDYSVTQYAIVTSVIVRNIQQSLQPFKV